MRQSWETDLTHAALGDSQRGTHLPNLVQVGLHNTRLLEVLVLKCRSVRKKTGLIQQCITDSDADIVALTETWLTNNDRDRKWIAALTPTGYKCINAPQPKGQRGGGIAVLHKIGLNCMATPRSDSHRATSFEHLECRLSAGSLTGRHGVSVQASTIQKEQTDHRDVRAGVS